MPKMSPEVDLLERLRAEDANLYESAYGSCYKFRDLAHVKRVVSLYVKAGVVELCDSRSELETAIPFHAARWIVDDDSNWDRASTYFLRITDQGFEKLVEDSEGFFDELFS